MTDNETSLVADLIHRVVLDRSGENVGHAFDVYVDDDTGELEWLAVSTGLFGTKLSFVPLDGAYLVDDDLMVAYHKDTINDAPRADADGQLSPEEEAALYAHYGRPVTVVAGTGAEAELDVSTPRRQVDQVDPDDRAGRVRLRKWIESADTTMTIPLRRENTRVVGEPVAADVGNDERI